jgi:hypothetical protein
MTSRMPDTGYGSARFARACDVVAAYHHIDAHGPRGVWLRLRAGSLRLSWFRLCLPSVTVRPTGSPAGRVIAEHFAVRERGHWKYRRAQGVLPLPAEFSEYMRGRRRQAVRTNLGHARKAGLTVTTAAVADWVPGEGDFRAGRLRPGPVEKWMVLDADGAVVADSILSVDEDVALLHGLVSSHPYARWLLHTAIVERLCGECSVLLVNSDDAYVMSAGTQHFQRLLGYEIARLRLPRRAAAPPVPLLEVEPRAQRVLRRLGDEGLGDRADDLVEDRGLAGEAAEDRPGAAEGAGDRDFVLRGGEGRFVEDDPEGVAAA